jgi:dephospho-CoA kinase
MKKAIFLTGSMGSGKSTILKLAEPISNNKYITFCKDFDILGTIIGADSLSKYKKEDVLNYLKNYKGNKLVIAGEYYSKQKDIDRFINMGFEIYCILLNVDRLTIYKRVLKRGGGKWNENTYKTNITNRVSFFKKFKGEKIILKNYNTDDILDNYNYIKNI